jgi:hypothetical protein
MVIVLLLTAPGCLTHTKRITNDSPHGGDYIPGEVYVLQHDAVIVDRKSGTSPTSTYYFWRSVPKLTVERPENAERTSRPKKYHQPVAAGTRFRFDELIYHYYFEDYTTYPFAVIENGSLAGKRVSIAGISRRESGGRFFRDSSWLQSSGP